MLHDYNEATREGGSGAAARARETEVSAAAAAPLAREDSAATHAGESPTRGDLLSHEVASHPPSAHIVQISDGSNRAGSAAFRQDSGTRGGGAAARGDDIERS